MNPQGTAVACGRALAADGTIEQSQFEAFEFSLQQVGCDWLVAAAPTRTPRHRRPPDPPQYRRNDVMDTLHRAVWGQGFAT